jgi:hypothetical protein
VKNIRRVKIVIKGNVIEQLNSLKQSGCNLSVLSVYKISLNFGEEV